jgi:hypothetical protein
MTASGTAGSTAEVMNSPPKSRTFVPSSPTASTRNVCEVSASRGSIGNLTTLSAVHGSAGLPAVSSQYCFSENSSYREPSRKAR